MADENVALQGLPVTRAAAKAAGAKHYFTGRPCLRGHASERQARTGCCVACIPFYQFDLEKRRASKQKYADAHRDKKHEQGKRYRLANADKIRARDRDFYERNRSRVNERNNRTRRLRTEADPERARLMRKAQYLANRAARIATTKRWQAANPERLASYRLATKEDRARRSREWALANPEKTRERTRRYQAKNPGCTIRWRKANPEAGRAIKQRYRARKRSAEGAHTADDIQRLGERQKWKCHWCAKPVGKSYHVDHLQPLSRGGSNWPTNLAITCQHCNVTKHAAHPADFARRLGLLI